MPPRAEAEFIFFGHTSASVGVALYSAYFFTTLKNHYEFQRHHLYHRHSFIRIYQN